ncbi:SRA stem-loop-interacting RNA-binding protein, mitochondrial-like [Hippopotamus amphibius kiboko]|uniref:SRA stem-loop-interacting RNA-binding protein, mitochondrial-like n=1 Tax=Hippopotamus amphibius kiboko TaxID=575201 RepID=UPI00259986C1|nr:SRA stem-loop-interacting RNA-binding protein, mitochondrial-like [Hippopotamus amphibius kiboko]
MHVHSEPIPLSRPHFRYWDTGLHHSDGPNQLLEPEMATSESKFPHQWAWGKGQLFGGERGVDGIRMHRSPLEEGTGQAQAGWALVSSRLLQPSSAMFLYILLVQLAASAARAAMALQTNIARPVAFVRKIPWTATSSELREHFAQFGLVRKCTVKETGFHRGMGWIQFSSEELHNALQQENHVIGGVKLHVQAQKPKTLQGYQTSDEEKDF